MKKLKFIVFQTVLAASLITQAVAEEKIQTADIQNDLLRASLGAKSKDPAVANKVINQSDLEIANKKLMAAEARLLEKANIPADTVNPILPTNNVPVVAEVMKTTAEVKLEEKNIEPPSAPLDINKVIAAIDRTEPEPIQHQVANPVSPQAATAALLAGTAPVTDPHSEMEKQLAAALEKNNQLMKELDETRNRLMIAETQVERLSSIIESSGRNKDSNGQEGQDATAALSMSRSKPIQRIESNEADLESDMQIAVVTADKVHLRTGPGKENSPLMAVTRGTRLAVETRNGEWYRVIAPTGARAWVSQDVISFSTADKIKSNNQVVGFNG